MPVNPAVRVERFNGPRRARVRLTLRSIVTLVEDTSAGSPLPVLALVSVRYVWSVLPEPTSPRDYRVSHRWST